MKINCYLQGYVVLLNAIGYFIILFLLAIVQGLLDSNVLAVLVNIAGSITLFLLATWVSLELMAKQVMLSGVNVLIAGMILIGVLIAAFLISLSPNKDLIL